MKLIEYLRDATKDDSRSNKIQNRISRSFFCIKNRKLTENVGSNIIIRTCLVKVIKLM